MKGDRAYLQHIRDAIDRIEAYASAGREEFLAKSHWQDAIIRQLEIIGEASKRLSPQLRDSTPHVPWRRICGLSNVLIHNYMGVDIEAIWTMFEVSIPALKITVVTLLISGDSPPRSDSK